MLGGHAVRARSGWVLDWVGQKRQRQVAQKQRPQHWGIGSRAPGVGKLARPTGGAYGERACAHFTARPVLERKHSEAAARMRVCARVCAWGPQQDLPARAHAPALHVDAPTLHPFYVQTNGGAGLQRLTHGQHVQQRGFPTAYRKTAAWRRDSSGCGACGVQRAHPAALCPASGRVSRHTAAGQRRHMRRRPQPPYVAARTVCTQHDAVQALAPRKARGGNSWARGRGAGWQQAPRQLAGPSQTQTAPPQFPHPSPTRDAPTLVRRSARTPRAHLFSNPTSTTSISFA